MPLTCCYEIELYLGDLVAEVSDEASFTFNWLALRLLGRGLYSNPWSALSELVANGLDAAARNVYVYVDARDKANAVVEVIDDGSGMNREDIGTYVKVGHNKRADSRTPSEQDPHPKGRKGIGKLAALFLSKHFFLHTSHIDGSSVWELDARDDVVSDDDTPALRATDQPPHTANEELWQRQTTGTRITMLGVDLTGYGPQSINALGARLANQFLLSTSDGPKILLAVLTAADSDPVYTEVRKSIAFGNFAEVAQYFSNYDVQPPELAAPPATVGIPAKVPGGLYLHTPVRSGFPSEAPNDEAWDEIKDDVDVSNRTYKGFRYSLTGWVGAHATIDGEQARANDARFVRNKYYNPAQIRVYVRGKLASDRLLNQLGMTGTYANYIEGELSFDLLDEDGLPDIATSNRQDFDETDGRVTLLRALARPIVRALIQRRNNLATTIRALEEEEKSRRDSASKRNFTEQVKADFAQHPDIPPATSDQLQMVIANKLQGDVTLKQEYRVFISHASADKLFASFIDEVLQTRGASEHEIFYTSRTGSVVAALDDRALGTLIRENIIDANTLIFYMTSKNFLASEFCLFEGGAGWATRSVSEYLKLNMDFHSIPRFLTNGRSEISILHHEEVALTPELHNYLIEGVFNPMIHHLNRGREIAGDDLIEPFERRQTPSAVEMRRAGESPHDYFDAVIEEHWRLLVEEDSTAYLAAYRVH